MAWTFNVHLQQHGVPWHNFSTYSVCHEMQEVENHGSNITSYPNTLTPYLGCFLSKLQAGEKVAVGTKQEDLLEDTFLHLGDHQPHQHVQGGSAHVQTGGVGEILLQVVEGPWKRAEEPP